LGLGTDVAYLRELCDHWRAVRLARDQHGLQQPREPDLGRLHCLRAGGEADGLPSF